MAKGSRKPAEKKERPNKGWGEWEESATPITDEGPEAEYGYPGDGTNDYADYGGSGEYGWNADGGVGTRTAGRDNDSGFADKPDLTGGTANRTPIVGARLVERGGDWYFAYAIIESPLMPEEWLIKTYHVATADLSTQDGEKAAYESGVEILSENWKNSGKQGHRHLIRKVPEQYKDGYFFVKTVSVDGGRVYHKSPFVAFPGDANWIAPHPIKNLQIEEYGDFPQGSNQPFSCVAIAYDPPDDMTGFWGVAVYVEGYNGSDELQTVTVHQYPESRAAGTDKMDAFNIYLEPDISVVMKQELYRGMDSTTLCVGPGPTNYYVTDYNLLWNPTGPRRAMKMRYQDATGSWVPYTAGCNAAYVSVTLEQYTATWDGGTWAQADPGSNFYFDEKISTGDTFVVMNPDAATSGDTVYYCEGIVDHVDETWPHRRFYAKLKYKPTAIPAHSYDSTKAYDYGDLDGHYILWKVLKSVKFYVVAINSIGYHGDLDSEALVDWLALDGLDDGPKPPTPIRAYEYETKNTIRWYDYPNEHIGRYIVYRKFNYAGTWRKIGDVPAKNTFTDPGQTLYSEAPYEFTDCDMFGISGAMYEYVSEVQYGVATVDISGKESIIAIADHYAVDGSGPWQSFTFRRTVGFDHGVYVMTRNNAFNLLWNADLNWAQDASGGKGNPVPVGWSLRKASGTGYPNAPLWFTPLSGTGTSGGPLFTVEESFQVEFASATTRDLWARLAMGYDTAGAIPGNITSFGAFPHGEVYAGAYQGLGRARLCIPSIGYQGTIGGCGWYDDGGTGRYFLYLFPSNTNAATDDKWRLKYEAHWQAGSWYLSTTLGTSNAGTDIIPSTPTAKTIGATTESWCYRNGWFFRSTDSTLVPTYTSGEFELPRPTLTSTGAIVSYSMLIPKDYFYPGSFATFSFQSYGKVFPTTQPTGYFKCRLYAVGTTEMYDPNFSFQGASDWDASVLDLAEVYTNGSSYHTLYMQVPDTVTWANVKAVMFSFGVQYTTSYDVTKALYVSQPMLNTGNEAAQFTTMMPSLTIGQFGGMTPPSTNPQNPKEDDQMCIHADSLVTLINGEKIKARKLKAGDILMAWERFEFKSVDVEKASHAKRIIYEIVLANGKKLRVSGEHVCMLFPHDGGFTGIPELVEAKSLRAGKYMLCWDGNRSEFSQVVAVMKGEKAEQVIRLTTSTPNNFFCDGILTHNMKAGEGQV